MPLAPLNGSPGFTGAVVPLKHWYTCASWQRIIDSAPSSGDWAMAIAARVGNKRPTSCGIPAWKTTPNAVTSPNIHLRLRRRKAGGMDHANAFRDSTNRIQSRSASRQRYLEDRDLDIPARRYISSTLQESYEPQRAPSRLTPAKSLRRACGADIGIPQPAGARRTELGGGTTDCSRHLFNDRRQALSR